MLFRKKKSRKIKVVVLGNCQARPIAQILNNFCSNIEITAIGIVHLLKEEEKSNYLPLFNEADYIFSQRVADNYPCTFVRTNGLKKQWDRKIKVWPNIYYRGYNPELVYLRIPGGHTLKGPLGDYHNKTFLEAWKKGLCSEDAANLHQDIDYNYQMYSNIPEVSFSELIEREADCDVKVSKYIEKKFSRERLFFTFNHPTLDLLIETTKSLLKYAGIKTNGKKFPNSTEPLGQIHPPANPWIKDQFKIGFDESDIWKGLKVTEINAEKVVTGKSYKFHHQEIVDVFYSVYSANKDLLRHISNS